MYRLFLFVSLQPNHSYFLYNLVQPAKKSNFHDCVIGKNTNKKYYIAPHDLSAKFINKTYILIHVHVGCEKNWESSRSIECLPCELILDKLSFNLAMGRENRN